MNKKLNTIFSGIGYILDSYSDFLSLKTPKKNTRNSDLNKLNTDWINIGKNMQKVIDEFNISSKKL